MIEINLLPWREEQRVQQRKKNLLLWVMIAISILLIIIALHRMMWNFINKKQQIIYILQKELAVLSNQTDAIKKNNQQYAYYQKVLQFFNQAQFYQTVSLLFFKKLLQNMSGNFYLTEIDRHERKIVLHGITPSAVSLAKLTPFFVDTRYFQYAKVVEAKKDLSSSDIHFQLELGQNEG